MSLRHIPSGILLLAVGATSSGNALQGSHAAPWITLHPSRVTGGASVMVTVLGPSGATVHVVTSNPGLASLPEDKKAIPEGTNQVSFVVLTHPVAGNPNAVTDPPTVDLIAQKMFPGGGPQDPPRPDGPAQKVTLIVLPATLGSFTLSASSVKGGLPVNGEVRLTGPAPAGGITISLASKVTGGEQPQRAGPGQRVGSLVSVPAQVTVPAGSSASSFRVTTRPVTAAIRAEVAASYGAFNTKTVGMTITP